MLPLQLDGMNVGVHGLVIGAKCTSTGEAGKSHASEHAQELVRHRLSPESLPQETDTMHTLRLDYAGDTSFWHKC